MIEKYLHQPILIYNYCCAILSRLTEDVSSADIDSEIHPRNIGTSSNYHVDRNSLYLPDGNPRFQKENQYEFPEDKQAKDQENSNFDSVAVTGKQLN